MKTWILRIALARLNGAAKGGSLLSLVLRDFDPIVLEINADGKLIGCCSLLKRGSKVFELEVIGFDTLDQNTQVGAEIINLLMKYVRTLGGARMLAGLGSLKAMNLLLIQSGFKATYSDDVLFLNL